MSNEDFVREKRIKRAELLLNMVEHKHINLMSDAAEKVGLFIKSELETSQVNDVPMMGFVNSLPVVSAYNFINTWLNRPRQRDSEGKQIFNSLTTDQVHWVILCFLWQHHPALVNVDEPFVSDYEGVSTFTVRSTTDK